MPMSELGAYLQRQRTERELSLDDIEARTRIRRKYLEAIETGDWDALPPGVYTRGLLKNYARALGINSAGVLRMYVKERPSEAKLPEPQLISRPLVETARLSSELIVGVALLLLALGLFAWTVSTRLLPTLALPPAGGTPAAVAAATSRTPTRSATAARPASVRTVPRTTLVPLPDEETATPGTPGTPGTPASPAPTATPVTPTKDARATATASRGTAAAPAVAGLVLEVVATSDAWLSVSTDRQSQFEGFLRSGDRRQWSARERVRLRTGNAGATEITINGRRLEPLGKKGDVVEREWRLLPSGDIEQSS